MRDSLGFRVRHFWVLLFLASCPPITFTCRGSRLAGVALPWGAHGRLAARTACRPAFAVDPGTAPSPASIPP